MKFRRIAAGAYETSDGRFLLWRVPDVYPPAWNVEDTSTYLLVVDGAATKRDALAIFAAAAVSSSLHGPSCDYRSVTR